jgi:SP family general alpha glucoside:H+ symporter-like MFS transporter
LLILALNADGQWFVIERFGRRFLSLWGLITLTVLLFLTGGIAVIGTMQANKAVAGFILVYCWLYNVTIGATAYVAMSEVSTTRLRAKTAALALLTQNVWGTFWSFILPFIFNPDKGSTYQNGYVSSYL